MINTILGTKIEQSQRFTKEGNRIPVTFIQAGPCVVVAKRTLEKDGYSAFQLGLGTRKKLGKSLAGQIKKANLKVAPRFLAEVRVEEENLKPGEEIRVEQVFKAGDQVTVTGVSKGKGFAGVVKRWGFAGGPKTHGQSDRERAPGSIGSTTTPGRVLKGKRMAGRMGQQRVTIKSLKVMEVLPEENLLVISGLIPGSRGGLVYVKKTGEAKGFVPLFKKGEKEEEKKEAEVPQIQTKKIRIKRTKKTK